MATIPSVLLSRGALASAVSAVVAGSIAPGALAQDLSGIEEVTVTARKRVENVQDVPQAVLAFSARDLAKLGITSLEDVARFAPAMTVVGSGAGLNKIVFRGLADTLRPFIADSSAAIYLDEQPLTTGSQSPVIRPIDLERIESLAGPQGTLYGASSQSGTVRYIVAKPDPSEFDANVGGGMNQIDEGDLGWDSDVMLNVPVIRDKLAVRLVGFAAKDAGYIDNVMGVTPYAGNRSNAGKTGKDFNDADWQGGRISAKWFVNDDWAVTGIYNNQHSKTHGFGDFDRSRGDLETVKFVDEIWDDAWSNYQFTVDGELGFAKFTSSTSYFERDTAYVFDATSNVAYYHASLGAYGRSSCGSDPAAAYYNIYDFATACELNGVGTDIDDGDPIGWFAKDQKDSRWTHETRLTGSTARLDWTLGFFYQEADQNWEYGTHIEDFMRTEAWAAHQAIAALNGHPPLAPTDVRWGSGDHNERKDAAVFGEGTVSLTAHWKLLAGARWYKASVDRKYYQRVPATADPQFVLGDGDEDDFLPKIGFQYVFNDERMLYALYSEGFRLGGVNRDRAEQRGLVPTFPHEYKPDILQNWEAGLKSRWLDSRVQLNVTGYHQVWKDMQLELFDPQSGTLVDTDGDGTGDTRYPFQRVIANLGDAVVDGFDLDLTVIHEGGLSAGLVSTYLFRAELDDDILVPNPNDPTRRPFFMSAGTRLPLSADLKFSAYLEYDWPMPLLEGGDAYARLQYSYTDGSWNQPQDYDGCPPRGSSRCFDFRGNPYPDRNGFGARARQPDYETVDLRTGFSNDLWEFSFYIDNLLDQRVQSYLPYLAATYFGGETIRTTDPRSYGMSVRRHFR